MTHPFESSLPALQINANAELLQELKGSRILIPQDRRSEVAVLDLSDAQAGDRITLNPGVGDIAPLAAVLLHNGDERREVTLGAHDCREQGMELALRVTKPLSDQDLQRLQDRYTANDIYLNYASGGKQRTVTIAFTEAVPTVDTLDPIQLACTEETVDVELRRAEIQAKTRIHLSYASLVQPPSETHYAGPTPNVMVNCLLTDVSGQADDYLKRNSHLIQIVDTTRDSDTISGRALSLSVLIEPGEVKNLAVTVAADFLDSPELRNLEMLRIDWEAYPVDDTSQRAGPALRDDQICAISRAKGELLEIKFRDECVVPRMRPELSAVEPFRARHRFTRSDFSDEGANTVSLSWSVLEPGDVTDMACHSQVLPVGQTVPDVNAIDDQSMLPVSDLTGKIDVPLDAFPQVETYLKHAEVVTLAVVLAVRYGGETLKGWVTVDIVSGRPSNGVLFCLDMGASAAAVWIGTHESNVRGLTLPLGDFAQSVFGNHREYDPLRTENPLLPTKVGLLSKRNARSLFDHLSLGRVTRIGGSQSAVKARLTWLDRIYDISLPSVRPKNPELGADTTPADAAARDVAPLDEARYTLTDLKRAFLTGEARRMKAVWRRDRSTGAVSETTRINLPDLLADVFDEMGRYIVPNALQFDHLDQSSSIKETYYEKWLKAEPQNMDVVITHPSGIHKGRMLKFKEAGRRFAKALCGDGANEKTRAKEPRFVPEALAAAYAGIDWSAMTDRHDAPVFACLDLGASTYDATLVQIRTDRDRPDIRTPWNVLAHFGGPIGGEDLDAALRDLVHDFVARTYLSGGPGAAADQGPFKLSPAFENRQRLLLELEDRIARAKAQASDDLRTQVKSNRLAAYEWDDGHSGHGWQVDLTDVLELNLQALGQRPTGSIATGRLAVWQQETGAQKRIFLNVPFSELQGPLTKHDRRRDSPRLVAKVLGEAVPTLLLREAARKGCTSLSWIVSGRTMLWPPIYRQLRDTVARSGLAGQVPPLPDEPEKLKQRVIEGARSMVAANVEISEGALNPLALLSTRPNFKDGVQPISDVTYLDGDNSTRTVTRAAHHYLVDAMPGLDEKYLRKLMSVEEIERLFGYFEERLYRTVRNLAYLQDNDRLSFQVGSSSIDVSLGGVEEEIVINRVSK